MLTLGPRTPNLEQGDVLVEDGRISEIGRTLRVRGAEVIDATDTIVMPGFVDAHRHTWTTLFRSLAATTAERRPAIEATLGPHLRPDDVYAATLLGLLSAAQTGITTVVDWSDIHVDADHTDAVLQAHAEAGVRTVLVHAPPPWVDDAPRDALRQLTARHPATTVAAGLPDPTPDTIDDVVARWTAARELGLRIHTHAGRHPTHGGVLAALASGDALREDVTVVHGTHLQDTDLRALAASKAALVVTPSAEMASGLGAPPVQRLMDHGIRPGLGVDDELAAPGDLFAPMQALQAVQHATLFDLKLAGKGGVPTLLTTREVIRHATIDGAHAAGLGAVTGSLEPGKHADLVLLRTDRPNVHPVNDPIGAVVWGMDASNVDWVLVGGRPLVQQGELVADVERVRTLALAASRRVTAAAGPRLELAGGAG